MVCGPADSGKSTLCATLCAYAARLGREPVFVDLDPGLGDCGAPPGAVAACRIDQNTLTVAEGLAGLDHASLSFWLGHADPKAHPELYVRRVEIPQTSRGAAVAVTWIVRGDASRRRRRPRRG